MCEDDEEIVEDVKVVMEEFDEYRDSLNEIFRDPITLVV